MPNTLVDRTMENIANVTDRHSLMAFLNSLNYQTEEIILDKEIDLGLPERATAIIKSIALISDYIFVFTLEKNYRKELQRVQERINERVEGIYARS